MMDVTLFSTSFSHKRREGAEQAHPDTEDSEDEGIWARIVEIALEQPVLDETEHRHEQNDA